MQIKVLFVCSGNQCRSPFAKAALEKFCQRDERTDIIVNSAGTIAMGGEPVNEETRRIAGEMGLDLGDHRANRLVADTLAETDYILVMENHHKTAALSLYPDCADRVKMLGSYAPSHNMGDEIPDPSGMGPLAHRTCFSRIIESVNMFYVELKKKTATG